MSPRDRIARGVVVDGNGCWIWQFASPELARSAAHEAFVGPVPDGVEVGQRCQAVRCIAPRHLVLPVAKGRQHPHWHGDKDRCKHGHRFTPENTRLQTRPWGQERVCKTCVRERGAARYRAMKEEAS